MAKNSIRDYSATNSSNTDIQSIDISEGCSPAGINNAIREVMADLKDVSVGTVALESPKFDSILDGNIKATDASGTDTAGTATTIKGGAGTGTGAGGSIIFQVADGAGSTGSSVNAHATAMTITDDGNVDISGGLNVGTIKEATGTTTAMTIDSSGHVLAPVNPKFSIILNTSTGNNNYTSTSTSDVPFDTEEFDVGNCVTISSDVATFTASVTGYYQFNLLVQLENVDGAAHVNTYLSIDGSTTTSARNEDYRTIEDPQGGTFITVTSSHLIYLTANQTVNPKLFINNDTSVSVRLGTRFSGFLVP